LKFLLCRLWWLWWYLLLAGAAAEGSGIEVARINKEKKERKYSALSRFMFVRLELQN
jgi:hypothetical protein